MANRNLLVQNPAGYQEKLQAADTLIVPGLVTFENDVTFTSSNATAFGAITGTTGLFSGNLTVDSNTGDSISIVLDTNGNITLSGLLTTTTLKIGTSSTMDGVLDEDDLTSDSDTHLATQQSIKAYVDAIETNFTIAGDVGTDAFTTGETLTFAGTANELEAVITNNTVTYKLVSDVTIDNNLTVANNLRVDGTFRFDSAGNAVDSILNENDLTSDSASSLATQSSIKAYVDNFATGTSSTNLSYTSGTRELASSTGSNVTLPEVVDSGDSGLMTGAQSAKLTGIETGATADQTGAEIKTAYEGEADTNAFTDAEKTKLAGIDAGAEVNTVTSVNGQTGAVSLSLVGVTNLSYTASTRELASSTGSNTTLPEVAAGGDSGLMTGADKTKLDGIEAAATADQTDAEIKTAYENNSNTNALTDALLTKLNGIDAGAEVNTVTSVNGDTGAVTVNGTTNLSYTAGTRELASSSGTNVTLPLVVASGDAGLMSGAQAASLASFDLGFDGGSFDEVVTVDAGNFTAGTSALTITSSTEYDGGAF
tara:strand:+ start:19642 stop:21258 length:1617 start_codon:yes stop_codon:yes gene_type:complete